MIKIVDKGNLGKEVSVHHPRDGQERETSTGSQEMTHKIVVFTFRVNVSGH